MPRIALSPLIVALALVAPACSEYASTAGPEHCGTIGDEVWGRDFNPHTVTCDITVAGQLVIGPGVRLRFEPGVTMTVNGSLSVEGTAERPVTFQSAEADRAWGGLIITEWAQGALPSSTSDPVPASPPRGDVLLRHLVLDDAGLSPRSDGALQVLRGGVTLDHVQITDSRQCGLSLGERGRLGADSAVLAIDGSIGAPICAHPAAVGHLPAELELDLADAVRIDVGGGSLRGKHVWRDLGLPLRVSGDIDVARGELHLGPGLQVEFGARNGIIVGTDAPPPVFGQIPERAEGAFRREQAARLVAAGTADAPVVLRSIQAATAETAWTGLRIFGGAGQVTGHLEHVVLEGAGAGATAEPYSLAVLNGASVLLRDVAIRDGFGAGLLVDKGTIDADSARVVIEGNAYPAVVDPAGALMLPRQGSRYTGNTTKERPSAGSRTAGDVIYVLGGRLEHSGTLAQLDAPYQVGGPIVVHGSDDAPTDVVVEPGVTLRFPSNAGLEAGTAGPAALRLGSPGGDPVRLLPAATEQAAWRGLVLGADLIDTSLHNVQVQGAGAQGSAVRLLAHDVLAEGLSIQAADSLGLRLIGTFASGSRDLAITGGTVPIQADLASIGSIPASGILFTGNADARVHAVGSRLAQSTRWERLGVPYFLPQFVVIDGQSDDESRAVGARLELGAGVHVEFAPSAGLRTERFESASGERAHGAIVADGTSVSPVVLRAAVPESGFVGVTLRDEDVAFPDLGVPFPVEDRSSLTHTIVDGGGALAALGALQLDASSPALQTVTVRNAVRFGVALLPGAFVSLSEPLCDTFTRTPFTFAGNAGDDRFEGQLGPTDLDVVDRRPALPACE